MFYEQFDGARRLLGVRYVNEAHSGLTVSAVLGIACNTNYFKLARGIVPTTMLCEELADWRLLGPGSPSKGLVHDGDARGSFAVGVGKAAALNDGQTDRAEVVGRDSIPVSVVQNLFG